MGQQVALSGEPKANENNGPWPPCQGQGPMACHGMGKGDPRAPFGDLWHPRRGEAGAPLAYNPLRICDPKTIDRLGETTTTAWPSETTHKERWGRVLKPALPSLYQDLRYT